MHFQLLNFISLSTPLSKLLSSPHGTSALIPAVRTAQFKIILSETVSPDRKDES
jgi:hypothetical protein